MVVYVYVRVYTVCVFLCLCEFMCLVMYYSDMDSLMRSEPDNRRPSPNSDLFSPWTRYTGNFCNSKANPWDNSEVHTGSCSEDQTAIQFQSHVISCECLLLYYFLFTVVNRYLCFTFIISCERLRYFTSLITCITS